MAKAVLILAINYVVDGKYVRYMVERHFDCLLELALPFPLAWRTSTCSLQYEGSRVP